MFTIINDWWHIKVWLIFKNKKKEIIPQKQLPFPLKESLID